MIENLIKKIIGSKCCKAYLGYGGILKLSFGEKLEYDHPKLRQNFHGEIDIDVSTYSWRLLQDDFILTGSSDSYEFIDSQLSNISDLKVLNFITNDSDIKILFEKGYIVESYCSTGSQNDLVEIYSWAEKLCFIHNGASWIKYDEKSFKGFTNEEELKSNHSKTTSDRWHKLIPDKSEFGKCKFCGYYLPISGEFYFWDYGLCSNSKSEYDGKVVGNDSYCTSFIENLKD